MRNKCFKRQKERYANLRLKRGISKFNAGKITLKDTNCHFDTVVIDDDSLKFKNFENYKSSLVKEEKIIVQDVCPGCECSSINYQDAICDNCQAANEMIDSKVSLSSKRTFNKTAQIEKNKSKAYVKKIAFISILAISCFLAVLICVGIGSIKYDIPTVWRALFTNSDRSARIIIFRLRLPRVLTAGLVGVCLSLSGCILQGIMRNSMASPSTIGVTSGASFVGYLTLVAFPAYAHLLPVGSIIGAFLTTMLIYFLAYQKGVSPIKIILSGLAVAALFGAFNDIIRTFFATNLANATGFLVGGLNGVVWKKFYVLLPYTIVGVFAVIFLPSKMNILMLGDETATSLGLRVERFRFILIVISSLLAGSAISIVGLISFVGLVVPHIARLLVGSNYKYLFPASTFLGFLLVVVCDTIGRVIALPGEMPVSIIMSFIGAPFFIFLLRKKGRMSTR